VAQTAEKMIGKLVIGGNLWVVADQAEHDYVYRSSDNNCFMLDSNGECQTRKGTGFATGRGAKISVVIEDVIRGCGR